MNSKNLVSLVARLGAFTKPLDRSNTSDIVVVSGFIMAMGRKNTFTLLGNSTRPIYLHTITHVTYM